MTGLNPDGKADVEQERWARVGTLFARAISLSPGERSAFLAQVCGDEATLRRELESLLAAHGSLDEAFLGDALLDGEAVSDFLEAEDGPGVIGSIGPWRVEEEIGRGGMGVVYRASRADGQFEQQVALKLIKRGMDSDQILRRFLQERQILADMEHPGIARLLDGGVTREGRPWLALEYVEGVPLTRYCDEQGLGLEPRLRLFAEVCEAVEYAHRNLVVHRDLKPSNILVDHSGRVKLLDFGIATLLGDDGSSETRTAAEGRLVTPGYGAPELVLGGRITTATDVYSLGVILYELLAGQLPYDFQKTPLAAQAQAMKDSQPPKLSDLAAASTSAENESRVRHRIDGELDTIASRAIQVELDRRYVSAAALREDVERYLSDEPVLACPDSLSYRLAKWGRRHRTFVTAAALVALSVMIGLGAALWQAGIAAKERDLARQEAAQTLEVKDFIIDLFRSTDPRDLQGAELTAERLLDRGLERVRESLESRPDLRLELLTAIAEAAMLLGDYRRAESVFLEALDIEVSGGARDQLRVALARNGLGETYSAVKENPKAVEEHRRALALRLEFAGPQSEESAQSYNNLGIVLADQGQVDEAIEAYEQARRIHEVLGEERPEALNALGNLGTAYRMKGDYPKAEELLRTVIDLIIRTEGEDHPNMIGYQSQLASITRRLGKFEEAERLWGRSLELSRKVWGEDHPITRDMVNNYAVISHLLGNDAVAAELMRENLVINIEQLGLKHRYVPLNYDNLASIVLELGDVEEAIELLEKAAELHEEVSPPRYLVLSDAKHAQAHLAAGQNDEALRFIDRAVAQERGLDAPNRGRLARVLMIAASVDSALGRCQEAEAKFHESLEFHRQLGSDGSLTAGAAHFGLAKLYLLDGKPEKAQNELERADEIWSASFPEKHWRRAELRVAQGEYWLRMGETEKGLALMDEGVAQLEEGRGENHWRTQLAMRSQEAVTGPALVSCGARFDNAD